MKEISLTQGKVAIVDDNWYDFLMQWKWYAVKYPTSYYAVRQDTATKKRVHLHRVVMGLGEGDPHVDHRDRDGLHNWRGNLRVAARWQNAANARKRADNGSGFIGVYAVRGKFRAELRTQLNGRILHLGYFPTAELAALVRDTAAIEHYGEFANLNFPREVI